MTQQSLIGRCCCMMELVHNDEIVIVLREKIIQLLRG